MSSSGLDSRVRARSRFGFRQSGLGFCQVFTLSFITNWGSDLVRVYVEKLGSGFCRVRARPVTSLAILDGINR